MALRAGLVIKTGGNHAYTGDNPGKTRDVVPQGISDVQC